MSDYELTDYLYFLEAIIDRNIEECDPDYGNLEYHEGAKDMFDLILKLANGDKEIMEWIEEKALEIMRCEDEVL